VSIDVLLADELRWPDVERAFGRLAGRSDSCWCQRFKPATNTDNRAALHHELATSDTPVGLLA